MNRFRDIEELIQIDRIDAALDILLYESLISRAFRRKINILKARHSKFKNDTIIGLKPDERELNLIRKGILECGQEIFESNDVGEEKELVLEENEEQEDLGESIAITKEDLKSGNTSLGYWWMICFTVLAIIATGLAVYIKDLGLHQEFYLRIIIAISLAGITSIVPGFFDIQIVWLRNSIRAGGAIGIFVLIYLINPATVNQNFRPTINLTGEWNFFLQTKDGDIPGGFASITHKNGRNIFQINGNVASNPIAPEGVYNTPILTFESKYALITDKKIIFHYLTNQGEEGVAVADYTGNKLGDLYFSYNDFEGKDKDGFQNGVLRFVLIEE